MSRRRNTKRQTTLDLDESFAAVTATASNNEAKFVSNPNRFYGRIGEDFEQWLREFERCARANHWSKDRCCEILPSLLRDRAADVWEEMPDTVQFDYDKTKEVLTEHFLPKEARRLYFSDLYGRQQGEVESVEEFAKSIQQLTRRAYSDMPSEYQDRLMREHFISGLRKSVQRMVILQDPDNFQNAVRIAKSMEYNDEYVDGSAPWLKPPQEMARTFASKEGGPRKVHVNLLEQPQPNIEERLGKIEALLADMKVSKNSNEGNKSYYENFRGRQNYRGTYCGNRGRGVARNLRASNGLPICNGCRRVGHFKRDCPDNKSGNSNLNE